MNYEAALNIGEYCDTKGGLRIRRGGVNCYSIERKAGPDGTPARVVDEFSNPPTIIFDKRGLIGKIFPSMLVIKANNSLPLPGVGEVTPTKIG